MKKIVVIPLIAVILLVAAYASLWRSQPSEPKPSTYFFDEVENYPWVRYAHRQQSEKELALYNQLLSLYSVDERIGFNLIEASWIKDYITDDEAHMINALVAMSEVNPEVTLNITQSFWLLNGISSCELGVMEDMMVMLKDNIKLAQNITSANWFFVSSCWKIEEMIKTLQDMPSDLALSITGAPWFFSNATLSTFHIEELTTLYYQEKDVALRLSKVYQSQDFEELQYITNLYSKDRDVADTFFQYNAVTRESFLTLAGISRISNFNKDLAYSLVGELTQDKMQIVTSLADIYDADPELGAFVSETFGNNRIALRYIQKVLEVEAVEHALLEEGALFVTVNPEFVYEDQVEPYRYHLLTQIISEFPLETAQVYKNLIFVTCSVYGSRFYLWQNPEYGSLEGWSSDRRLFDLEREAVMTLLTFLIEKNEERALVTDLRLESYEYLYGVLNIPFTHLVNYDGTAVETSLDELGTSFVFTTIYNINTLEQRFEVIQEKIKEMDTVPYNHDNPVAKLVQEEGGEQDLLFLYFCVTNWELGTCVDHTMHTRMDSIALGISTTTMDWAAPESAHVYPAYIPSSHIIEKIKSDPKSFDNPFVYKNFIAPYDEAGFKNSLDRNIDTVNIYDPQAEREVGLFSKKAERIIYDEKVLAVVLIGIGIIVYIVADTLRIVK